MTAGVLADASRAPRGTSYNCPEPGCEHTFDPDPALIREHLEAHHNLTPDGVRERFCCHFCGETSDRRSAIVEHVRERHPDREVFDR